MPGITPLAPGKGKYRNKLVNVGEAEAPGKRRVRRWTATPRSLGAAMLARATMEIAVRCRRGGVIINEHVLTGAQTRRHIEALGRWFDFIALDDLPARLAAPRARPFCLLTFDDGKRSNVTESAPELERAGIPAVFYVVTDFLTEGRPLWFDRYRVLVERLGHAPAGLEAYRVKQLPYTTLIERLDRACAAYGVEPDTASDAVAAMTWDDARDLRRRGFEIGAHGVTHAILTLEPADAAMASIRNSIARVAAEVGRCSTFAFPNGNYTAALASYACACGASSVMTVEPTWVDPERPFWRLPRIQIFGPDGAASIEWKLSRAATGSMLASPDGTGREYTWRWLSRRTAETLGALEGPRRDGR